MCVMVVRGPVTETNVSERATSIAKRIATDGAITAANLLDRYATS
jgi:hypothetical protein